MFLTAERSSSPSGKVSKEGGPTCPQHGPSVLSENVDAKGSLPVPSDLESVMRAPVFPTPVLPASVQARETVTYIYSPGPI